MPLNRPAHLVSSSPTGLTYYLYRPRRQSETRRVMVAVHGVSRNAMEHVELFRPLADSYGVMLIAPLFKPPEFRDYQRLGRRGKGARADLALIRLLNEIENHTGVDTSKTDYFGFSGGAQFVHRFGLIHSQRVRRVAVGSAGWYTMPNPALPYPYGTANADGLDRARLNLLAAARIRTLVLVGALDNQKDDAELNQSRIVRGNQGLTRVERARTWCTAMNAAAERAGLNPTVELKILPGVGHAFSEAVESGGLANAVFDHCYGPPALLDTSHAAVRNAITHSL